VSRRGAGGGEDEIADAVGGELATCCGSLGGSGGFSAAEGGGGGAGEGVGVGAAAAAEAAVFSSGVSVLLMPLPPLTFSFFSPLPLLAAGAAALTESLLPSVASEAT
jgi:hypothetical protein